MAKKLMKAQTGKTVKPTGAISDIKTGVKLVDRGVTKGVKKVEKKVGQAAKAVVKGAVKGAVKVAKTSPYDVYKAGKKAIGYKKGGSTK